MSTGLSHAQGELLALVRPQVSTPVLAFLAQELRAEITLITAVVTGSTQRAIALHHDVGGQVWDNNNIILRREWGDADDGVLFQAQHPGSGILLGRGDSLGVTCVADTTNIAIYGITETLADRVRPGVS